MNLRTARIALTAAFLGVPAVAFAGDLPDIVAQILAARRERAQEIPDIPADAYTRALGGEVVSGIEFVDGAKAGKGWGVMVYDAPVEAVWQAVNDEETYPGRMPLAVSKVVAGQKHRSGRTLFQYMELPVVNDRWWMVRVSHNAALYEASGGDYWESTWTAATDPSLLQGTPYAEMLVDSVPVEFTTGAWLLVRLPDGRTLGEYWTWSDPGGALPAGLASRFAGGAIKDTLVEMGEIAHEREATPKAGFVRPDRQPMP